MCEASINKKTDLLRYNVYCSADARVRVRSLCEVRNNVYTEMGVVCCGLIYLSFGLTEAAPEKK